MERTLPRPLDWRWIATRAAWATLVVLYVVILARYFVLNEWSNDAHSYWHAWEGGLYDIRWHGAGDAYVYSPAFAQALWPLTLLDWPVFYALWTALLIGALVLAAGPVLAALGLVVLQPLWQEIAGGNVDMLIGLAIAVGFRYPAAWAFVLLTKVTPGVGLLWFVVRREWRSLGVALGATATVVAVSFVVAPSLWFDWARFLEDNHGETPTFFAYVVIQWPLLPRVLLASAVVTWGALTNRPWTVLVAAFIASPLPTSTRSTMLVGLLPLLGYGPLAHLVSGRVPAGDEANDRRLSPGRGGVEGRRSWYGVGALLEAARRRAGVRPFAVKREGRVVGAQGEVVAPRSGGIAGREVDVTQARAGTGDRP